MTRLHDDDHGHDGWLAPSASGLRHLRWAREIRGALAAQLEFVDEGGFELRRRGYTGAVDGALPAALSQSYRDLSEAIDHLSAAAKDYRDFLERRRTGVRGRVRAARAWGLAPGDELARFDAEERRPRREAVRAEVARLRAAVGELLDRLSPYPAVRASLLPRLADPHHVADDEDPDDDATAAPAPRA